MYYYVLLMVRGLLILINNDNVYCFVLLFIVWERVTSDCPFVSAVMLSQGKGVCPNFLVDDL